MSFRSPYGALGEGIGQGLRDLAQTLIGEKQRQQQSEEQLAREKRNEEFQLMRDQGQLAQQDAGAYLQSIIEARGNLTALQAQGVEVDPQQLAGLDQILGGLQGVRTAGPREAPGMLSNIPGIGQALSGAAGTAAGEGANLNRRQALQEQNLNQFTSARATLMDPNLLGMLGKAEGMAAFLAAAEQVRALSRADMPDGTDIESIINFVGNMENVIAADPALATLRETQLAGARSDAVIAGQAAAQAQLQTALLGMDIPIKQLTIEEAQEAIAGMRAQNAVGAYDTFERTGLIPPGFEARVEEMYRQATLNHPGAPDFEKFRTIRFEAYRDRLDADAELLQIDLKIGRDSVKLSEYAVDDAEYQATYRDLDRFIAMQGNAGELVGAALAQGDVAAIRRMINALDNPDTDPGMARFLQEAGLSAGYLNEKLLQVMAVEAFQTKSLSYATREIESKWKQLDLQDATQGIMAGADIRDMIASTMTPEQAEAYVNSLSDQQRALLGGTTGISAIQTRSRIRSTLEQNEMSATALQFIAGLADMPISADNIAQISMGVQSHLERAGVDAGTAAAIATSFADTWNRGLRDEARTQATHEAQLALWSAQGANYLQDPASGVGADDLRDLINTDRQLLVERRQNIRQRQEAGGCIPLEGMATVFGMTAPTPIDPAVCANLQSQLNVVDGQLIESSNRIRGLIFGAGGDAGTSGLMGGDSTPGAGTGHPLHGWDLSAFSSTQSAELLEAYNTFVRDGTLDPNDDAEMMAFIMSFGQMWQVPGFYTVPDEGGGGAPTGGGPPQLGPEGQYPGLSPVEGVQSDVVRILGAQAAGVPVAEGGTSWLGRALTWAANQGLSAPMPSIPLPGQVR